MKVLDFVQVDSSHIERVFLDDNISDELMLLHCQRANLVILPEYSYSTKFSNSKCFMVYELMGTYYHAKRIDTDLGVWTSSTSTYPLFYFRDM